MTKHLLAAVAGLAMAAALAGCTGNEATTRPLPVTMNEEAVGHFCQMYVLDHEGPKAQIHLAGFDKPLWFAQVSDAVAYLKDQERDGSVSAVYVSDMGKAVSWAEPGADNWIDGENALYVINSARTGGMGQPEAVPFSSKEAADGYIAAKGGIAVRLDAIPDGYVHPAADLTASVGNAGQSGSAE